MDSKVADFFKEIDALTVPEELIEEAYKNSALPPETETVKKSSTKNVISETQSGFTKGKSEASCPWQEIKDDSSGYSYYWNVHTNDVTWECPQEYVLYIQSTQSSIESSTDKKAKKEKKKKETPALPVGSIIPISYYGNSSSSEECSDIEKDSSKLLKKEKHAKASSAKKKKASKKLSKNKVDESGSDVIGPQLPPDFQFPVNIPLSPNGISETVVSTPTLAKETALPKSSSSPEQSSDRDVDLPTHMTESTVLDEKLNVVDKETGKESTDSVLKRGDNGVNEKASHTTINSVFGLRPVVDYDSFTDEEDEIDASNTSPTRDTTADEAKLKSVKSELVKDENVGSSHHLFPIITEPQIEITCLKRKVEEDTTELSIKDEPVKKLRKNDMNIDKLFAAHTTYGKHGFGFGWQSQSNADSVFNLDGEPNSRTKKVQLDKTPISFVKSNDVLDLKSLNDDLNLVKSNDADNEIEEEMPTPVAEVKVDENSVVADKECSIPNESDVASDDQDSDSSPKIEPKGVCEDVINKKQEDTSDEKVEYVQLSSLDVEEDIDEIDRALCEALEAKKAAKNSQKPSSGSSPDLKKDCEPSPVKLPVDSAESDNEVESSDEKERDTIFEISTDVIDKLTFLLSNHTALASHNAFLVQLQTRFVDWQAKALETKYFTARLGEVQDYLQNYEASIISGDWMCQWDRANKRYFYVNKTTQVAQWTYPEDSSQSEADSPLTSPQHEFCPIPPTENTSFMSTSKDRFEPSPPPPPPGVDSPPPLPPQTPPPDRLPPPPPDITSRKDPEDMDLENSNDLHSPQFISRKTMGYLEEEDKGSFPQNSPVQSSSITTPKSMTAFHDLNAAAKISRSSSLDGSDMQLSQSSGSQRTVSESSVPAESSQPIEMDTSPCSSSNNSHSDPSRPKTNKSTPTSVKKEKKKKKLQLGIGLKKKNMPSLVEKWLKIKEEQEKEDNDSEVLKSDAALKTG